jgi:hypothetical protein
VKVKIDDLRIQDKKGEPLVRPCQSIQKAAVSCLDWVKTGKYFELGR